MSNNTRNIRSTPPIPKIPAIPKMPSPPSPPSAPKAPSGGAPVSMGGSKPLIPSLPSSHPGTGVSNAVGGTMKGIKAAISTHSVAHSKGRANVVKLIESFDLNKFRDASGKITPPFSKEALDRLKYGK